MFKISATALWILAVALISSFGAAYWAANNDNANQPAPYLEGLEYRKLPLLTVPMIVNGQVAGYVLAKLVFTADARTLREVPIQPDEFVTDEAFTEIYTNGKIDFGKIDKYNIPEMVEKIKTNVNKRLNIDIVHDILLEGMNYLSKDEMREHVVGSSSEAASGGG
ncbi:hypothetical protein SAMN02745172_01301 [Pseudoxanthobacter soli DSM 19599]|uniref:Uncharacterized protein n=1 Tax=Pseudoxanthobacter soli DSM 19599 TaxID=1123029 RepID=A0A1M7ZE38_9HYPH|nr:hypothetical protein [Pseudoxanthobacter soli]SHO63191.1 hypothetical protein SAMN02745172_01301 [Pseudoxanthobacter soli DSM 19599]